MSVFSQLMMKNKEEGENYITSALFGSDLTINNGVVSGFTNSNYIKTTEEVSFGNNFELCIKIKTSSSTSLQCFFSGYNKQCLTITYSNGYLSYNIGDGSSWIITGDGNTFLNANTDYYIKISFNGNVYLSEISTDGINYVVDWSANSSHIIPACYFLFGIGRNLSAYFSGTIDLRKCYLLLGNTKYIFTRAINASLFGSNLVVKDYTISNFSSSSYATANISQTFNSGEVDNFKIEVKIKTSTSWTSSGRILNWKHSTPNLDNKEAPFVVVTNQNSRLLFYDGTDYYVFVAKTTLLDDKEYWFKWEFDGENIKSYYKEAESDSWILNDTTSISKSLVKFESSKFWIGIRDDANLVPTTVWKGEIDISETSIEVNNTKIYKSVFFL